MSFSRNKPRNQKVPSWRDGAFYTSAGLAASQIYAFFGEKKLRQLRQDNEQVGFVHSPNPAPLQHKKWPTMQWLKTFSKREVKKPDTTHSSAKECGMHHHILRLKEAGAYAVAHVFGAVR